MAVVSLMMIEQSARWLLTSATRAEFVADEFQIDYLRDQPGRGGFAYGGRIVSSGETVHTTVTNIVSIERLRELQAAGAIPGAREPVRYLASLSGVAALDAVFAFRIQSPDTFEIDAAGWVVVNVLFAAGAVWLIRRGVRLVKQGSGA